MARWQTYHHSCSHSCLIIIAAVRTGVAAANRHVARLELYPLLWTNRSISLQTIIECGKLQGSCSKRRLVLFFAKGHLALLPLHLCSCCWMLNWLSLTSAKFSCCAHNEIANGLATVNVAHAPMPNTLLMAEERNMLSHLGR